MINKNILKSLLASVFLLPSISYAAPENKDTPFKFRGDEQQASQDNPIFKMHQQVTSGFDEMLRNFFNNGGLTAAGNGLNPLAGSPFEGDKFLPLTGNFDAAFPKTDVVRGKDKIDISVEMPGVEKDKIILDIAPGFLTVSHNQDEKKERKDKNYVISERKIGSIKRVIPLPYGAKIDDAEATYKNGVVYISVPTMDDTKFKPRRLEIE